MRVLVSLTTFTVPVLGAISWYGADISSVPIVEASGITYKDTNGAAGSFESIAAAHGMNAARIRLWTAGQYNTAFGLSMGKVAVILIALGRGTRF